MNRNNSSSNTNQALLLSFEENTELRFSDDDEEEENHKPTWTDENAAENAEIEKEKQVESFGYMELALQPLIEKEVKKVLRNNTFSDINDIRQELSDLRENIRGFQKKSEKKWDALKKEGAEVYDNVRAASQKFFSTTQECFNDVENNFKKSEANMMQLISKLSNRLDGAYEKLKVLEQASTEKPISGVSSSIQELSVNSQKKISTHNISLEQISEIMQQQQKKFEEMLHQLRTEQESILAKIYQQEQKNQSHEYFSQDDNNNNGEDGSSMSMLNTSINTIDTLCSTIESPEHSKSQEEILVPSSPSNNNIDTDTSHVSRGQIDPSSTEKTKDKAISMDDGIEKSKQRKGKRQETQEKKKRKKRGEESKSDKEEARAPKTRNKQKKTKKTIQDPSEMEGEEETKKKSIHKKPSKRNGNIDKILLELIDPTSISSENSANLDDIILPDTFTLVVSKLTAAFKGVIKVSTCKASISKYLRSLDYSLSTTTKNGDTFIAATKKATN